MVVEPSDYDTVLAELKAEWRGTLILIGQLAEERVLGAQMMLKAGLYQRFPKPDLALMLHVSADTSAGSVALTEGYALANVDSLDIVVHGVGGAVRARAGGGRRAAWAVRHHAADWCVGEAAACHCCPVQARQSDCIT